MIAFRAVSVPSRCSTHRWRWIAILVLTLLSTVPAVAQTTKVFIDFGFGWTLNDGNNNEVIGDHFDDGLLMAGLQELRGPGTAPSQIFEGERKVPNAILPMHHFVQTRGLDYNGNGVVDIRDSRAIASDVVARVRRLYEPFDVDVVHVEPANLDEIRRLLEDSTANDAYVFSGNVNRSLWTRQAGWVQPLANNSGFALVDVGNTSDNLGFAWAVIDSDYAGIDSMAKTIAHEAGHMFGLTHSYPGHCFNGPEEQCIEIMSYGAGSPGSGSSKVFSRVGTQRSGEQSSYDVLAANLGLRRNTPAYLTGTGLHDEITIYWTSYWQAMVIVNSYTDSKRTKLSSSRTFFLNSFRGLVVDAGPGDDLVETQGLNQWAKPLELRGGHGADELRGGWRNDTIEGGLGHDILKGGAGNDKFVLSRSAFPYLGPNGAVRPSRSTSISLGTNRISGGPGLDTLDVSSFDEAVRINLSSSDKQIIDRQTENVNGVVLLDAFSPDIENVAGTPFDDIIVGNSLRNQIRGGSGNDELYGGSNFDILDGGRGKDRCVSGERLHSCEK